mgnify:CR=1 FL=1
MNINLKNYKNLKILVTGSTGFKGSWLCFWLNLLQAKIIGVSLKPEKGSIILKKSGKLLKKYSGKLIEPKYTQSISSDDINKIFDEALQENPELVTKLCEENLNETTAAQEFLHPVERYQGSQQHVYSYY